MLRLLLKHPSVSLDAMKYADHNISRTTAWRSLSSLRDEGYVSLSGKWSITQQGREWFCGPCKHYKTYVKQAEQRHREVSQILLERARRR